MYSRNRDVLHNVNLWLVVLLPLIEDFVVKWELFAVELLGFFKTYDCYGL